MKILGQSRINIVAEISPPSKGNNMSFLVFWLMYIIVLCIVYYAMPKKVAQEELSKQVKSK